MDVTTLFMHIGYTGEGKSAENVVQAYLSDIFAHKGGSIVILSDNEIEFKNAVLTDACEQCGIQRLHSHPFHPQGNLRIYNVHNFLTRKCTRFQDSSDLEWDELLLVACTAMIYSPLAMALSHHFT